MKLPVIKGLIRRRILANFSADPTFVGKLLPVPLRPKLVGGRAVVGICLIRLEEVRPKLAPSILGIASENAAHRFAVTWIDETGAEREGVYIPRRDTSSTLSHWAGGRVFPGEHHLADFDVTDEGGYVRVAMRSRDGGAAVEVEGRESDAFDSSLFGSIEEASDFFRRGSLGYSERADGTLLDGITLHTDAWSVRPLAVSTIHSSYFDDRSLFPEGTATFDCALLMRDVSHEWRSEPALTVLGRASARTA